MTAAHLCGHWWEDGDGTHSCSERGEHGEHRCDEEDCAAVLPTTVKGGRRIGSTRRPKRA